MWSYFYWIHLKSPPYLPYHNMQGIIRYWWCVDVACPIVLHCSFTQLTSLTSIHFCGFVTNNLPPKVIVLYIVLSFFFNLHGYKINQRFIRLSLFFHKDEVQGCWWRHFPHQFTNWLLHIKRLYLCIVSDVKVPLFSWLPLSSKNLDAFSLFIFSP